MALELHENHGKVTLDTIRRLYRRNSRFTLYKLIQKIHPAEMAWIFRYLSSEERRDIFQYIRRIEGLSSFLNKVDHALVPDIFNNLTSEETASTISILPPEELVELLESFPADHAEKIQSLLKSTNREELADIMKYADESAGRIMSHAYMAFNEKISVSESIQKFQQLGEDVEMPFYIYVVDDIGKMLGVLSLQQLLLNKPEIQLH